MFSAKHALLLAPLVLAVLALRVGNAPPTHGVACALVGVGCPAPFRYAARVERDGWQHVVDVLRANYEHGYDRGGSVALFVGGDAQLDVTFGYENDDGETPYADDAVQLVFSSTKFVTSCAVLHLIDAGKLEWDAPVARYWPEFAANGKENVTVADVMSHAGGVHAPGTPVAAAVIGRGGKPVRAAMAAAPLDRRTWRQAGGQGYHALTRGYVLNALVELVDAPRHRNVERYVRDELLAKLAADYPGADALRIGVAADDDDDAAMLAAECASAGWPLHKALLGLLPRMLLPALRPLYSDVALRPAEYQMVAGMQTKGSIVSGALTALREWPEDYIAMGNANAPGMAPLRRLHMSSSHGFTNARTLARLAAVLAQGGADKRAGVTMLSRRGDFERATALHDELHDHVLHMPMAYSAAGFGDLPGSVAVPPWHNATEAQRALGRCVGWGGAGGSFVHFCPKERLAFAYVPSFYSPHIVDWRGSSLLRAALAAYDAKQQQ